RRSPHADHPSGQPDPHPAQEAGSGLDGPLLGLEMARALLDPKALEARLRDLPLWEVRDGSLERRVELTSYRAAQHALNRLADLAEGADHHPDVEWSFKELTIRLRTHDVGGITGLDVRMAGLVEAVLESSA